MTDSRPGAEWDRAVSRFDGRAHYLDTFLGDLKRRTHLRLIERWDGLPARGRILKTDLFEEAVGPDAYLSELGQGDATVIGMDVSPTAAGKAQARFPRGCMIAADVRRLPFADGSFALIVSPSTLDHFPEPGDLSVSLRELARVLEPGGRLIITVDNRQNIFDPLLRLADRMGLVPYYLGRSYTVRELCHEVEGAGLVVSDATAILHNPRLTAVGAVALARRIDWRPFTRWVQRAIVHAQGFEKMWWRYYTGSFVAVKAVKRR